MGLSDERWRTATDYAQEVFGVEIEDTARVVAAAEEAQLPNWAVTAEIGRLLQLLVSFTGGRLAVEVGTLGGYSAVWIARGLAPGGRLITIEYDDAHGRLRRVPSSPPPAWQTSSRYDAVPRSTYSQRSLPRSVPIPSTLLSSMPTRGNMLTTSSCCGL